MNVFNPNLICPLCAKHPALNDGKKYVSREHIPASSIFVKGTNDLITVPSCKDCNNGTSHFDIEFKITLGLYLGNNAPPFWQSTIKSLNKNAQRKRLKQSITERISPILIKNNFGVLGHKLVIDNNHVKTVVTKIARGLHWRITGHCLPADSEIKIYFLRQGQKVPPEIQAMLNQYGRSLESGAGAFKAHYTIGSRTSMWKLIFYGVDCFLVKISPAKKTI